jgi:hypothetical protein
VRLERRDADTPQAENGLEDGAAQQSPEVSTEAPVPQHPEVEPLPELDALLGNDADDPRAVFAVDGRKRIANTRDTPFSHVSTSARGTLEVLPGVGCSGARSVYVPKGYRHEGAYRYELIPFDYAVIRLNVPLGRKAGFREYGVLPSPSARYAQLLAVPRRSVSRRRRRLHQRHPLCDVPERGSRTPRLGGKGDEPLHGHGRRLERRGHHERRRRVRARVRHQRGDGRRPELLHGRGGALLRGSTRGAGQERPQDEAGESHGAATLPAMSLAMSDVINRAKL